MAGDLEHPLIDRLLTTEEAAAYLACPPTRIRYLVKIGRLRTARDVRRLIFKKAWLDQAVGSRRRVSRYAAVRSCAAAAARSRPPCSNRPTASTT
ncbi:MAG TPA: helix-turn-helix domain-containing protein [Solirubrobacteraceae bacterium]|nr:helix-turn-helix domain-containing protein [Solirubrobacteraceae bacterium]